MAYDRRHTLITPGSCPKGSPRGYSKVSNLMRVSFRISFRCLTDEVRAVKTSMTNFIRHPLDETLSQLIAPLAAFIIRSLGKKRSSAKPARSSAAKT